jgi:hypothetical protein
MSPDPAARCEILETLVTRDESFYWLNLHLNVNSGASHDLQKRVSLETSQGARLDPADTTLMNKDGAEVTEIWFKFWLDQTQLKGPLTLHLNDAALVVRSGHGIPNLGSAGVRNFTTDSW